MNSDPKQLATRFLLSLPGLRRYRARLDRLTAEVASKHARITALEARLCDLEHRLAQVRRDRTEVRARLAALKTRLTDVRAGAAAHLAVWRERTARARRGQASSGVLERLLPLRHAALLDSGYRARAQEDHAALMNTREPYRAAFAAAGGQAADADRTEVYGLVFWVPHDARGPGSLSHRLLDGRLPLREIVRTREVSTGRVMLDIGANVGTTAIPRVVLGDVDRVFAAEPEPRNFACLVRNIRENGLEGFIVPDAVAISDQEAHVAMQLGSHIGTHRLGGPGSGPVVRATTLDAWVADLSIDLRSLAFIKCDTQGHEPKVMRGAPEVLAQRQAAWQIEFSPSHITSAGEALEDFYGFLSRHFDWFIDIGEHASGDRIRAVSALGDATAYVVERRGVRFTNLLLFNGTAP